MSKIKLIFLLAVACCVAQVRADQKAKPGKAYMFGVSMSFTDSIVYITDLQELDTVYFQPKTGYIAERTLYSAQLQLYLEEQCGQTNQTSTVFYNRSRKKLEKTFLSVKKKYAKNKEVVVQPVGTDKFRFQTEMYYTGQLIKEGEAK
ncbi:MAG: hypothetical protein NC388_01250 [Clostridium sp.]|nr:hypothetical protein [Clostridium sp.]